MAYVSLFFDILRGSVLFGIIIYILLEYKKKRSFANLINKIPGPRTLPIVGNLIQTGAFSSSKFIHRQTVLQQHRRGLCKLYSEHGIFRLWFGPYPFVMFHKPESVKALLNSNVLIDKSSIYRFLSPWLGNPLFLRKGSEEWRPLRHALTPAFHFRILQDFIPIVNSNSELLVDKLRNMCDEEGFDIVPVLTMTTLDIFSESSFGVNIKSQEDAKMRYVTDRKVIVQAAAIRSNIPWTIPDFLFDNSKLGKNFYKSVQLANEFAKNIINERVEILSNNKPETAKEEPEDNDENIYFMEKKKRLHLLDLLLDREKKNLGTRENTRNEVDNLILAGHDTTQSSLAFTLHLIGSHPEVQEKIHEEVDRVFEGDRHRPVTNDDLSKLAYTDRVVKESLRLFPTVPIIGRTLTEDLVVDGHTVPKGAQCLMLIQEVHRDPESFPNPEVFDPDRFLLENCRNRHPYAYIPFSAGARNCLGIKFALNEVKIMVAIILRNFQVRSLDPVDKLHLVPELVMFVHSGIRMSFKER